MASVVVYFNEDLITYSWSSSCLGSYLCLEPETNNLKI